MIDLHVHSTYSDGSETVERVVDLAARAGCTAIALTDHDTMGGVKEAQIAGARLGIEVINGVELSCHTSQQTVHILGYFLDAEDELLQKRLSTQRDLRNSRNERLIGRLNGLGVAITHDDVARHAGEDSVGRPHVAAALVEKGYARTIDDAFALYLGEGGSAFVERRELTAAEGIRWIREAGGVASWAHPLTPSSAAVPQFEATLEELVDAGLSGIEATYGRYDRERRHQLQQTAQRRGLVATGGSDFHGSFKPDLQIGRGTGDLHVHTEALDELRLAHSSL